MEQKMPIHLLHGVGSLEKFNAGLDVATKVIRVGTEATKAGFDIANNYREANARIKNGGLSTAERLKQLREDQELLRAAAMANNTNLYPLRQNNPTYIPQPSNGISTKNILLLAGGFAALALILHTINASKRK